MFAGQERSFHLFLQGHPEYEPATLLREYRRDIGRYLRGERDGYPAMPRGYFDDRGEGRARGISRKRALADRSGELHQELSDAARWRPGLAAAGVASAIAIYENWFEYLKGRKAERALAARADAARLARLAARAARGCSRLAPRR